MAILLPSSEADTDLDSVPWPSAVPASGTAAPNLNSVVAPADPPQNPTLQRALALVARGFPVLPLVPGGKKPLTKHGFHEASTDAGKVRGWWAWRPDANLGIPTGAPSGFVVVDLDTKKDKNGPATFQGLLDRHGGSPPPFRVRTPSGGQHLYFRHPGGNVYVPCSVEELGPGIDVRADGGYVVVPPSRTDEGAYEVIERGQPPDLPPWLLALILAPPRKPARKNKAESATLAPTASSGPDAPVKTEPGSATTVTDLELNAALRRLPADNYATWLTVGMALKDWDSIRGLRLWEEWSKTSAKYEAGTCAAKWETFSGANAQGETVTAKTVLALAQAEDEAMVSRLAGLDPATYDRVRDEAAKRAGLRTSVLDRMVEDRRTAGNAASQDGPVPPEAEPWPAPVDGAELLTSITSTIKRFLVSGPMVPEILAVWSLHTYLTGAAAYTPILALLSPEKRCGKSVALSLLARLTRRPLVTANATPAALYRAIEAWRPTLLIDEFDSHSRDEAQVELRNILNSGFHRSGSVLRCEGEDSIPTPFTTFCPKAVASIGDLPETAMDRAIIVRLRRKLRTETTERLRKFDCPELRQQCVRWAADHAAILQDAGPKLPEALNDRQQDIWEPLLAIADQVGGDWPSTLREAAILIAGEQTDEGFGLMLLQDIETIFTDTAFDRIATADLLDRLNALDERPWCTFAKGQPITAHRLARLLKPYSVMSQTVRGGKQTFKGYFRDNFTEAWDRYLPAKIDSALSNTVTTRASIGENEGFESVTTGFCDGSKNTRIANDTNGCDAVTVQNTESPPRIDAEGLEPPF